MATNLDDLISANEHYYSSAHQQMNDSDNLYNQDFYLSIDLPENITVHKSSKDPLKLSLIIQMNLMVIHIF